MLLLLEVAVPSFVSLNPYSYYLCNMVRPVTFIYFGFPSTLWSDIFYSFLYCFDNNCENIKKIKLGTFVPSGDGVPFELPAEKL